MIWDYAALEEQITKLRVALFDAQATLRNDLLRTRVVNALHTIDQAIEQTTDEFDPDPSP